MIIIFAILSRISSGFQKLHSASNSNQISFFLKTTLQCTEEFSTSATFFKSSITILITSLAFQRIISC
jgi:hypothetical protein